MNDVVFTSFFLIEIYFTIVLVVNCAVDELLPIGEYKTWLQNKNWFGKIYTAIVIIFTIPAAIIIYIVLVEYGITIDDEAAGVRNGGFGSTTENK